MTESLVCGASLLHNKLNAVLIIVNRKGFRAEFALRVFHGNIKGGIAFMWCQMGWLRFRRYMNLCVFATAGAVKYAFKIRFHGGVSCCLVVLWLGMKLSKYKIICPLRGLVLLARP